MKYTLQDFLDDKLVPAIKVHTAPADLSSIPVVSSRIQEPPFDEFFEKGELIISKVWGWENNTKMMDDLVLIAHEKEVAALIWALHDSQAEIPQAIITLAERLAVPLFEVPWETSFAKMQSDIFDAIRAKEVATVQMIQQMLFDHYLEQSPLSGTAGIISRELHCPVRITDTQGIPVSESGILPKETAAASVTVSIESGDSRYGAITFFPAEDEDDPLFDHEDQLRKYIAFPLSFWFNRENMAAMTQSRIRNDFVWDLATGMEASQEDVLAQGRYLGFDLTASYVCVMLYLHTGQREQDSETFAQHLPLLTADAERVILQEAKRLGVSVMTARVNQSFIIYIKNDPVLSETSLSALLDDLEIGLFRELGQTYTCLWGISETGEKDPGFSTTYQQARQALVYGMHEENAGNRIFFRSTRRALITSVLSGNNEIQDAAADIFKDLLAYDKKTKVGLMQTLMVYLSTNYNATQTAKELHLNRHSLLYRLRKIEQFTGLSLNDHEDLFVLEAFALAHEQR